MDACLETIIKMTGQRGAHAPVIRGEIEEEIMMTIRQTKRGSAVITNPEGTDPNRLAAADVDHVRQRIPKLDIGIALPYVLQRRLRKTLPRKMKTTILIPWRI